MIQVNSYSKMCFPLSGSVIGVIKVNGSHVLAQKLYGQIFPVGIGSLSHYVILTLWQSSNA